VLSKNIACIEDSVEARISLNPGEDIRLANIKDFEISVNYNPNFLKVIEEDIQVGDLINSKFNIEQININDVKGEFLVKLNSKTDILNFPNGGEILKFKLRTFLPNALDSTSEIMHQILIDCANCIDFYSFNNTLILCFNDYWRIIHLSTFWNTLKNIRPNPAGEGKINIEFSIGIKNFTEIKIYDITGQNIAIAVSEVLEPGIYNVPVDVSNLPIGAYWCDLISGSYHETKMFIVK